MEANETSRFCAGNYYFLDLSRVFDVFPFNNIIFDSEGIVRYDYMVVKQPNQTLGVQYNNSYICWWALGQLQVFLVSNKRPALDSFLKHAEWLLNNRQDRGDYSVWPLRFDYVPTYRWLRAPWCSGMDQGLIISVLTRAYKINKDPRYLQAAQRAGLFFSVPVEKGGPRAEFSNGDYYYEMYPVKPLSKILDGFLFALMGLHDLLSVWEDERILAYYKDGLSTLLRHVDFWDFQGFWSRFGTYYLSPPWYHKLNLAWLKVIYALTNDKRLPKLIAGWDPRNISGLNRRRIKVYSYLFSRSANINWSLKRRLLK